MADVVEIDRVLDEATRSGGEPGVVAFAANRDGAIYQGAFGRRGLTDPAPMALDTTFWMHSMTKAVTGVAAMQCVEQGKLKLDQPAGIVIPQLAEPQVLDGFNADGKPLLRSANHAITLHNLLTHSSGFVYEFWNANLLRYCQITGMRLARSGRLAMLDAPLAFEPGGRWEYGIGIDWAGRMVEAVTGQTLDVYMREDIFAPLAMNVTGYTPTYDQVARLAHEHTRKSDGSLEQFATLAPRERAFFPSGTKKWGMIWFINTEDMPDGRGAGSLAWAGLRNTYFWLDSNSQAAGVLLTQIFPFADPTVLRLLDRFKRAVYQTLAGDSADA